MTMCPLYLFADSVLFWLFEVLVFCLSVVLLCILFSANLRYLQWVRASCKCCSSVLNSSSVEQTVPAQCKCTGDIVLCCYVMVTIQL